MVDVCRESVWRRLYVKARAGRHGPYQKVVCPIMPDGSCDAASDRNSRIARDGSKRLHDSA